MFYDEDRHDMVRFLPESVRYLLDVGCATGRFADALRDERPSAELWGIDTTPPDRPHAYRERLTGSFPNAVPAGQRFDCIVFNDVLEHMVDPWAALTAARELLLPGGVVVASIPNVRHVRVLSPLIWRGRWDYQDYGILDRTHLRFFTRASMLELFSACGFDVTTVDPIRVEPGHYRLIHRLALGRCTEFFAERYALVAKRSIGLAQSCIPST